MAIVDAVANGNWADFAVTFGGVEPQPGDVVRLNGFNVTISNGTEIEVEQIWKNGTGRLIFDFGDMLVRANLLINQINNQNLSIKRAGLLTIIGDLTATAGAGFDSRAITLANESEVVIQGNVSTVSTGLAIRLQESNSILRVFGNVLAPVSPDSNAYTTIDARSNGFVNVVGDVFGGTAGGNSNAILFNQNSSGEIDGNATGGSLLGNQAIRNSGTGTVRVRRSTGGILAPGVLGSSTGMTEVTEIESGPQGQFPIGNFVRLSTYFGENLIFWKNPEGDTTAFVDPATFADLPIEADVRDQTIYAHGNRVGTLKVPTKFQTAKDVPVDDTLGEAVLTQQDVIDALGGVGLFNKQFQFIEPDGGVAAVKVSVSGIANTTKFTDGFGNVDFSLDEGNYTLIVAVPPGYASVSPFGFNVSSTSTPTIVNLTKLTPSAPASGGAVLSFYLYSHANEPLEGITVRAVPVNDAEVKNTVLHIPSKLNQVSGEDGRVELTLLQGVEYRLQYTKGNSIVLKETKIAVPFQAFVTISQVLEV